MKRFEVKMISKSLISVIVPIYNVEKYLSKSLDSIVNQTYKDIEIIIVDDGSTDSSGKIADDYSEKFSGFQVFHTVNKGLSEARNYGLKKSKGDYIFFLDPDDWIEKNLFEIAIARMNKDGTNLFLMNFSFVSDEGEFIRKNRNARTNTSETCSSSMIIKEILLNHVQCYVWQLVVRRNVVLSRKVCHTFKNVMYEDVIWTPKTIQLAKLISVSDNYFYNYRQRNNSIVHVSTMKSIEDRKLGIDYFNDFIQEYFPQLQGYLGIWNLAALIHLYAMCTTIKQNHDEVAQLQKCVRKQIRLNKNLGKLKITDKIKYFLIVTHFFGLVTRIKNYIKVSELKQKN